MISCLFILLFDTSNSFRIRVNGIKSMYQLFPEDNKKHFLNILTQKRKKVYQQNFIQKM